MYYVLQSKQNNWYGGSIHALILVEYARNMLSLPGQIGVIWLNWIK